MERKYVEGVSGSFVLVAGRGGGGGTGADMAVRVSGNICAVVFNNFAE